MLNEMDSQKIGNASARVNPDGTFRFDQIGAHLYGASLTGTRAYIKAIRFRGVDAIDNALDLRSGLGGELEMILSLGGGRIEGIVPDGRGLAPKAFVVWPKIPRPGDWMSGVKGGSGYSTGARTVSFQGLSPGDYYIAAFDLNDASLREPEVSGLLQVPEFLAGFTAHAAEIHIDEGSNLQVEMPFISRDAFMKAIEEFR